MIRQCLTCEYYCALGIEQSGPECREDSPRVFPVVEPGSNPPKLRGTFGVFPPTAPELWCGKWRPRSEDYVDPAEKAKPAIIQ